MALCIALALSAGMPPAPAARADAPVAATGAFKSTLQGTQSATAAKHLSYASVRSPNGSFYVDPCYRKDASVCSAKTSNGSARGRRA